jgi:predicted acyl esterase
MQVKNPLGWKRSWRSRGGRFSLGARSSNFSRFARNSNTGGEIASEAAVQYRPAINRIFHDTAHPSRLILPIIER